MEGMTKEEEKKMGQEIAKTEGQSVPSQLIQMAMDKGTDLDKLEKLLILQERWETNEARKAYNVAMSDFKADPPKIDKDKKVNYGAGKAAYNHASLYNVTEKINAALSKHGLSASWNTKQNGSVIVTCKITHAKGHSEETTLAAPADSSGSKNSIQAIGSTITYLERYTLLALTGLATFDQDDDGKVGTIEYVDEKQLSTIRDYVDNNEGFEKRLLTYLKIESIEKMAKKDFSKAVEAMRKK